MAVTGFNRLRELKELPSLVQEIEESAYGVVLVYNRNLQTSIMTNTLDDAVNLLDNIMTNLITGTKYLIFEEFTGNSVLVNFGQLMYAYTDCFGLKVELDG